MSCHVSGDYIRQATIHFIILPFVLQGSGGCCSCLPFKPVIVTMLWITGQPKYWLFSFILDQVFSLFHVAFESLMQFVKMLWCFHTSLADSGFAMHFKVIVDFWGVFFRKIILCTPIYRKPWLTIYHCKATKLCNLKITTYFAIFVLIGICKPLIAKLTIPAWLNYQFDSVFELITVWRSLACFKTSCFCGYSFAF